MSAGAITFDVRRDRREIEARLARLGAPGGARTVLNRTINRVMDPSVRAVATDAVVAEIGAKRGAVRAAIRVRRSTTRNLEAAISGDVLRIGLMAFRARPTARGVTYQIGKSPRGLAPRAFIRTGIESGLKYVLRRFRKGEGLVPQRPIGVLHGPSVSHVLARPEVLAAMHSRAVERWARELPAQLRFYLDKQGIGDG